MAARILPAAHHYSGSRVRKGGFDPVRLAAAGLVPEDLAGPHALMSRMLVAGRLLAPDGREPPPSGARALARACGFDSYDALGQAFAAARLRVAGVWKQIFGTDILETEQENPA